MHLRFWLLGGVLAVVEMALAWAWFQGHFAPPALLSAHVLVAAACYVYLKMRPQNWGGLHHQLLFAGLCMFGFVGVLSVMLGVLLTQSLDKIKPAHFDETFDDLFGILPEGADLTVFRHIEHYNVLGENLVVSDQLSDMFEFGSDFEKQTVLAVVNSHYQPKFAKIIRKALQSSNNVIRIQAAAILADQEQKHQQKLIALEKTAKTSPNTANKIALAQHYDHIAHSGVVDPIRQRQFYEKAAKTYEKLIKENKDQENYQASLARVYYRLGKNKEAAKLIEEKAKTLADVSLSLWYLELLFANKNFAELRAFAKEVLPLISGNHQYPIKLQGAVKLWATSHQ